MRKANIRKSGLISVAIVGTLTVVACSGPAAKSATAPSSATTTGEDPGSHLKAANSEGALVWYSSLVRPAAESIAKAFHNKYPQIDVKMFQAGGSQIIAKVESEAMAGGVKADVVDYSETAAVIGEAQRGLFQPYLPPNAQKISDTLIGEGDHWIAPFYVTATIVYNTDLVKQDEAPTSWKDLTNPRWKGKLGMASPDYAGTAVATIATWKQKFGDEYIKHLGANKLTVFESFGNVHDAVLNGQTPVAVSLSFRALPTKASGKPLNWITPKEGQIPLDLPVAITKNASHPNAAKLFTNFLFSRDIQTMMAKKYGYFPAVSDVAKNAGMPDTATLKLLTGDLQEMADPQYIASVKKVFKQATS